MTFLGGWASGLALLAIAPGPRVVEDGVQAGAAQLVRARRGPGGLWIGPLDANGGRDVLVYRPPAPHPDAMTRIVVHFHGTYSETVQRKRDGVPKKRWVGHNRLTQTLDAMDELQRSGNDNVLLVYPFSAGKRAPPWHTGWWNQAFDSMWMDGAGESFTELVAQATDVAVESLAVDRTHVASAVTAEGHSAGGLALYNVAHAGAPEVAEYIFLDAAFEGWADGCYEGLKAHRSDALLTVVMTERGIADPFAGRTPWCLHAKDEGGERWDDARAWCEAMADDAVDLPHVYLHRTKVRHGDQPRRFSGGLGLPATRFAEP
ncbi:MAG: hypothetical protein AAF721_00890 [Myxococcota bacterium]